VCRGGVGGNSERLKPVRTEATHHPTSPHALLPLTAWRQTMLAGGLASFKKNEGLFAVWRLKLSIFVLI